MSWIPFGNACKSGNKKLVLSLISDGENRWNLGLDYACNGGHKDIIDLIIESASEKGAHMDQELNWNRGMASACAGGHKDIVLLMIEKGANDWDYGLENACRGGHMDLVLFMIEKGSRDWNWGLAFSCDGEGHKEISLLMLEKGATAWRWVNDSYFSDGNIYYLVQKGVSYFERHYKLIADSFRETQKQLPLVLDNILNKDLILEIMVF